MRHLVVPGLALGWALTPGLALPSAAAGQGASVDAMHNARRLGGATAFYTPPFRPATGIDTARIRR